MRKMWVTARATVDKQTEIHLERRKEEVPKRQDVVGKAYTAYR